MKNIKYFKNYLYDNPIKSIFIMINVLGGLLFLFYFMHIGFMPTLHIQDMMHLVFTMAFMGLLMILLLVMLLVAPALMWKYFVEKSLSEIIEISTKKIDKNEPTKEESTIRRIFAFNLLIGTLLILWLMLFANNMPLFWCLVLVTVLIAMPIQYLYFLKDIKVKGNDHFTIVGSSLSIYAIIIFPILVLTIVMKHADDIIVNSDLWGWLVTVLGLMLVVLVNVISLYDKSIGAWKYFVPFFAIVLFVFFAARDIGFISRDVMRMLHMGNFKASKIVIKSDMCQYLSKDYPAKKVSNGTNSTCSIRDIYVYSRIGQEVLIDMSRDKNITDKIILFKKDIISYAWEGKVEKSK